ncbi:MAG: DUF1345 domain-containing protein [Roseiarcus sp.]
MSLSPSSSGPGRRPALLRPFQAMRRRPRLYICCAATVGVYLACPADLRIATRALLAWNAGALLFVALVGLMIARSTEGSMRSRAFREDDNQSVLLLFGTGAACASIAAIFAELGAVKDLAGLDKGLHIGLTAVTILSAWTFIHLLFALHYAQEYYARPRAADGRAARAGLRFPGDKEPGYGDFLYYSFVIGCACATADVETISRTMRRATLAHGVVAFFFNTIILALTINIGAGLV